MGSLTDRSIMWKIISKAGIFQTALHTLVLFVEQTWEQRWHWTSTWHSTGATSYSIPIDKKCAVLQITATDILGGSLDLQTPEDFKKYIVRTDRGQTCSICHNFSHSSKSNVRKHIESRHFPNSFSYSCPNCATVVGTQMALDKHMAIHKNQMLWKLKYTFQTGKKNSFFII